MASPAPASRCPMQPPWQSIPSVPALAPAYWSPPPVQAEVWRPEPARARTRAPPDAMIGIDASPHPPPSFVGGPTAVKEYPNVAGELPAVRESGSILQTSFHLYRIW